MVLSTLGESFINISFLRILRALRLVRIMKTIRVVRFFGELRVMVYSIVECLSSLASAMALLTLVTYVFAVYITQHVANFFADDRDQTLDDDTLDFLFSKFGTLGKTMLSLFEGVTGGISWGELSGALMSISREPWLMAVFFCSFVGFTSIALMNIVTGIFVDNAIKASLQDKDMVIRNELAQEDSYMNDVMRMFREADADNSGQITWDELNSYLQNPRVKAYFDSLELHHSTAKSLFKLLDTDGDGSVNRDEFVLGCTRLKGGARSVDVATLMYENKKLVRKLSEFIKNCMAELMDVAAHESKVDEALGKLTESEMIVEQKISETERLIAQEGRDKS
eukprot:gnl/MRDRNA2_/MRDRNA2_73634_c0_seq2.p1 gnl/MRDRNA2_/MRDRNA2_73634_c0~~gnl/MRDRNA2_/MRDRNA2_73634_c0_seq2.p1  ORF type:complete len:338 (+),score=70.41 gnl/MRDRNA2_/MRDRNA2_73634_c0_seq2:218-1231(+)